MAARKPRTPKSAPPNVTDIRAYRRKAAAPRPKALLVSLTPEERVLDLHIGLALLGTDGCTQLSHYLWTRTERAQRRALARAS